MEEDQANWLRAQLARRRGSEEEGSETGEAAAAGYQESGTGADPGEWDQRGLLTMEPTGQESRGAASPEWGREKTGSEEGGEGTGPQEAAEPGPSGSGGPGGGEMAAPEVERRREGRGEARESGSGKEAERPGGRPPRTFRERYWEGSRARYRERTERKWTPGTKWKYRLERKPQGLRKPSAVDNGERDVLPEETKETLVGWVPDQEPRQPTIRFTLCPRSRRQSQWSSPCRPSGSVINELAKMGDPDVLEMVQEKGGSRRKGAGADRAPRGPRHHARSDPGGRWRLRGLDPGDVRGTARLARDGDCERNGPCPGRGWRPAISPASPASLGPVSRDPRGAETTLVAPLAAGR